MNQVVEKLLEKHLLILERGLTAEQTPPVAKALMKAGIRAFEITFRPGEENEYENGRNEIAAAVKAVGENMYIGAGTVLDAKHVQMAYEAGASFIVSPGLDREVVEESKRLGLAVIPGALTPSEIMAAWKMGADMVKLFPADDMGMHYIKNLRGPLKHIPLLATGGVNPDTIPEFFEAGINAVGTGVTVVKPELVKAGNYEEIYRLAALHIDAVNRYFQK